MLIRGITKVWLYNSGKYDEAIQSYEKVLKINPRHYSAWNNKAVAFAQSGNYEE